MESLLYRRDVSRVKSPVDGGVSGLAVVTNVDGGQVSTWSCVFSFLGGFSFARRSGGVAELRLRSCQVMTWIGFPFHAIFVSKWKLLLLSSL
jgi:hypothetical protein